MLPLPSHSENYVFFLAIPGFPTQNLMESWVVNPPPFHIPTPSPNVQVTNAQVLNHEMVEVLGLKIWGAGWHPRRGDSKSGNNYTDVPKEVGLPGIAGIGKGFEKKGFQVTWCWNLEVFCLQ